MSKSVFRSGAEFLRLRAVALVAAFAGVVLGGTTAYWGFPPSALATTSDGQCNGWWITDATRENGFLHADPGVRASGEDHVYGGGRQCAVTASVMVISNSSLDYVEAGWGTTRTAFNDQWGGTCNKDGEDNTPHAMYFYRKNSTNHCTLVTTVTVHNEDNPTTSVYSQVTGDPYTWIFDFSNGAGGSFTFQATQTFTLGIPLTNCDRHFKGTSGPPPTDPSDPTLESCQAHFTGMQYRIANPSPHWAGWGNEACYNNNGNQDPNYNNQLTQNGVGEVTVSTNPGNC